MSIVERMAAARIIPVIALDESAKAVPLARALVRGGLEVLEITFRTACAAEAIRRVRAEVPEASVIAGTVLTCAQLAAAQAAGAEACVAPGFDPALVGTARAARMPFCPGIATASELSQAMALGCRFVKFFPAEALGGAKTLKALLGAFRGTGVSFMPTGGVNPANVAEYLSIPEVACCGGTWIVPRDLLQNEDWEAMATLAKAAKALTTSGEAKAK